MSAERMTPERLAEIRQCVNLDFPATRSYVERIARELRAELDAVTRERDEARQERDEARELYEANHG